MVGQQRKQLKALEQALRGVLDSIQFEEELKWPIIFEIIYIFQHNTDAVRQLYDNYLNEEERKVIMNINVNRHQADFQEWRQIIREVRATLGEDPGADRAQRLAEQWMHRVSGMFGDNHNLQEKMWDIIKNHSGDIAFYPMTNDVVHFMERAINIMYERQERSIKELENKE